MRSDDERLLDIAEAIARIERYHDISFDDFVADELIQTWVIHHLQITGEAVRGLSPAFRSSYPTVPWAGIVGTRNIIVHSYFGINTRLVWNVIRSDLPIFAQQIEAIIVERGIDLDE